MASTFTGRKQSGKDTADAHLAAVNGDRNQLKNEEIPAHREIRRLQQVLVAQAGRSSATTCGSDLCSPPSRSSARSSSPRSVSTTRPTPSRPPADSSSPSTAPAWGGHRPPASEAGAAPELVDHVVVNDGGLDDLYANLEDAVGAPVLVA